jgi:hypothetical protein
VHIRAILGNIRVTVVPNVVALPSAAQAFTDDGNLADEKKQAAVEQIGTDVAESLKKLLA